MEQAIIDDFRFEFRFLSNFEVADILYEDLLYPSTEHAYQAAKSLDPLFRKEFAKLPFPRDAKRMGRKIEIRDDWEQIKDQVMFDVCWYKFSEHERLKQMLLATEDAILVEGNTWGDTYWGVCNGAGQNKLGKTLMRIRTILNETI